MNNSKKKLSTLLLITLLIMLSFYFYRGSIRSFPHTIHAWAQSDHYALALNFERNSFNFFKPETFVLNPQFPGRQGSASEKGITSVDFPLTEFIVAGIMKAGNHSDPWMFRLYVLITGLLGLYFLYRITYALTSSTLYSFFIVIFAFTAPVYTYYQCGFLPSVPAMSFLFAAYYHYLLFRQKNRYRYYLIAIALFTLSALIRLPFAIFLIALFCQILLYSLRDRKISLKQILPPVAGFAAIGGYFLYNHFLAGKYGSVFLSNIMPPDSFENARELLMQIRQNWKFEYLSLGHYITFLILIIAAVTFMILRKKPAGLEQGSWLHLGIAGFGVLCYFFLMMKQFTAHDYYFLDTFFPLIMLSLILLVLPLPRTNKIFNWVSLFLLLLLSWSFISADYKVQQLRYTEGSGGSFEAAWRDFQGGAEFLDGLGISRNDAVMVLNAASPNIALIQCDRKGYSVFGSDAGVATQFLNRDWKAVLIQDNMPVSDMIQKDSLLFRQIQRIAGNGRFSVYMRSPISAVADYRTILALNPQNILLEKRWNFESPNIDSALAGTSIVPLANAGDTNHVARIAPESEFTELFNGTVSALQKGCAARLLIQARIWNDTTVHAQLPELVFTLSHNDSVYVYTSFLLADYLDNTRAGTQYFCFQYTIPELLQTGDRLKLYFWNHEKDRFDLDDISLTIAR
jgi:hypothetical protein